MSGPPVATSIAATSTGQQPAGETQGAGNRVAPSAVACTVATRSHLAFARLLGRSWLAHHPGSRFVTLVPDHDPTEVPAWTHAGIEVVGADSVGLEVTELERMAAIYDPGELACALKPWVMSHLLDRFDVAVYLDGDTEVLAPMDPLVEAAAAEGLVLVPHTLGPLAEDGRVPDHVTLLQAGVYNGGLIAVSSEARDFLGWWAGRLARHGLYHPTMGMHADQRWLDVAPCWFSHTIWSDPTYDVAYWNLAERATSFDGTRVLVEGRPLAMFHYSGLVADTPWELSRFQGADARVRLEDRPEIARLCRDYVAQLRDDGLHDDLARGYVWATSSGGHPIDYRARHLWRDQLLAAEAGRVDDDVATTGGITEPPSPFAGDGGAAWLDWITSPVPGDVVSRYLRRVWDESVELQRAHPDLADPVHRLRFLRWAAVHGPAEATIPAPFLPTPEDLAMPDPDEPADLPPPRRIDIDLGGPVEGLDQARASSRRAQASAAEDRGALNRLRHGEGALTAATTEATAALVDVVAELSDRIAHLGDGLERTHDRIDEVAEREALAAERAREDRATLTALGQRFDELSREVAAVRDRADGALTQHEVTASVVADAEARLEAAVAELTARLNHLDPDRPNSAASEPGSSAPGVS